MINALTVSNILLWIVVITMGIAILALVRQIGVLHERVSPAGALMLNKKLHVGVDAPLLPVKDLAGNTVNIGGRATDGKSRLLFFLSPDCPVCKSLLSAVLSAAKAEQDWLELVFASDGSQQDHQEFVDRHGLQGWPYVVSEMLGMSFGVAKLPYGVLIDEAGRIASMGIINSREHLDSLFEAKERNVASIQEYVKQSVDIGEIRNELAG